MRKHEIQHNWQKFEQFNIGKKIEKVLEDIEENGKNQEWFSTMERIQERFKDRYKGWWIQHFDRYEKQKTCIICQKKPNCLKKYNLSKDEIEKMMF